MKTLRFSALVSALVLLCSLSLQAREQVGSPADWVARGDSLRLAGEVKAAREAYKQALKLDKHHIGARMGLGKLDLLDDNWGDAGDHFGEVLEIDPDNVEAHYYKGICHRETGKFKVLLLRKFDWDASRKHFQWVVDHDKYFRDVLFQFAVLKRYQDRFEEAIQLAQEQVAIRPDMAHAHAGLLQLYRALIRHRDAEEAEAWLRRQVWDQARFTLGELWRRRGDLDRADSLFRDLLSRPIGMSRQPVLLALAKIEYARGHDELGERYFWRAVDTIQDSVDAFLVFEEIKYILSEEELQQFLALQDIEAQKQFFRQFWTRRDPTPASSYNVRLAEHFQRLMYAEKYYEYDGFRTWFNSPDKFKYLKFPDTYRLSNEFNDKGLIYIRHGPPDEREVTVSATTPSNESWRYYQRGDQPELIFHFVIDENATGNNWRLTPIITHPEMLADRVNWGSVYHRMLNADPLEVMALETEMAEASAKAVKVGFETDRHSWPDTIRPLEVTYSVATFRGDKDSALVEVYYGVPVYPVAQLQSDRPEVVVEQGLAVHDSSWQLVARKVRRSVLKLAGRSYREGEFFIERFQRRLLPGRYRVSLHARTEGMPFLGGYQFDVTVPDYWHPGLAMSDLQLAYRVEPAAGAEAKFVKNGLQVIVNPSMRFARNQPVFAYFEIYNLRPDASGTARYRIEYTLKLVKSPSKGLKKLFGFLGGGGKSAVSLSSDRETAGETAIEWVSFDVTKMRPGLYEMVVKIEDRAAGSTVEKSIGLTLY